MDLKSVRIGIIGAGTMAEAILRGITQAALVTTNQLLLSDLDPGRLDYLHETFKIRTTQDNCDLVATSDIILLAVKPQNMNGVLKETDDE